MNVESCPSCNGSVCVLQHVENSERPTESWSVGCSQAFMRRMHGQDECKDRPVVTGLDERSVVIGQWNAWVANRRQFLESQS